MRDWPLLLVVAAAMLGAALTARSESGLSRDAAIVLVTAGLITHGVWLVQEARRRKDNTDG